MGIDDVMFKMPVVIVNALAIPNVELVDNWRDVPLIVILKRLAVPLKTEVPTKVAVPAYAEKLPPTERPDEMEKLTVVVIEPETAS